LQSHTSERPSLQTGFPIGPPIAKHNPAVIELKFSLVQDSQPRRAM